MGLAEFIIANQEAILAEFDAFARTQTPASTSMSTAALRDHAGQVLIAIAIDIRQRQSPWQESEKSKGHAPDVAGATPTAAQTHGDMRATVGFDINQTLAEYRALRASVIRMWLESKPQLGSAGAADLVRFNEAIDQAVAESIHQFTAATAREATRP